MWATWLGAMAGFISMTTGPLVVSRVSVLPSLMSKLLFRGSRHFHGDDLVRVRHRAVVRLRSRLDLVHDVHARDDLAEGGVLAVEEPAVTEHDEELRVGRIGVVGAGHAEDATLEMGWIELGLQVRQVGAALARAGRVAGLGHEAGNDAVEHDAVVETALHQRLDLLDMLR